MSRYRDQVAAALDAVAIRGATQYAWLGRVSRPMPASLQAELSQRECHMYLTGCLREELYASFYCHGRPVSARWGEPQPAAADPWLERAISESNSGRGGWESGWTIERLLGDDAIVATPRLRTRIRTADCRPVDGALRVGGRVSLRLPKGLPSLSPGFHTVIAEAETYGASYAGVVRVYWNVGRAGAPALVRALTSRLNGDEVPFRLKIADHPVRLDRCDAAVLYLRAEIFGALRDMLRDVAGALTTHLRRRVPAFTLALAPGVGLAEDDTAAESFGERRCGLLAEGIVRAHEQGVTTAKGRLEIVAARFAQDGVSIDAPYLESALAGRHVL
jgi:hypothetical protein